ncbi:MAG: cation:proton antiporter [Hyphomicrobiaceae bacterium]|nr:cation:proton antiporter [Hyphomicrobiaceae bacterium]
MAASINFTGYSDVLVLLGTAGVVVPLVRRYRINPVLAYLAAGIVLGPLGLGQFKEAVPLLHWLTIIDAKNVEVVADLGVVFLLFLIGLELSYVRLLTMRRLVFGLGMSQVAFSALVISIALAPFLKSGSAAIAIGCCLALSSTAIVIEVLSENQRLSTSAGRASFSILLAQDLAVVPILLFISVAGAHTGSSILAAASQTVLQAVIAAVLIGGVGHLLLRPLFRLVAAARSTDLFIAATLFVIVGTGVAAAVAGMSMALGAFLAGLLLAETEFRKAIEATVEPFKGLLLGLFFFTVGMSIDVRVIAASPFALFGSVLALVAVKAALTIGLARLFRLSWPAAIETGLLLGPGGEFAFVGIALAASVDLILATSQTFLLALTSLSMALIPALSWGARRITSRIVARKQHEDLVAPTPGGPPRAIVVGHGRMGETVCDMLEVHQHPFVATDRDHNAVREARKAGRDVYFGDAANPEFLKALGVMTAPALIVTIHDRAGIDEIVRVSLSLRPDLLIISRARDATHASHLYKIGVADAVPETIEASLQLSEAALVGLGLPTGKVIASIHDKRDDFRRSLLEAAGRAGRNDTRGLRAASPGRKS